MVKDKGFLLLDADKAKVKCDLCKSKASRLLLSRAMDTNLHRVWLCPKDFSKLRKTVNSIGRLQTYDAYIQARINQQNKLKAQRNKRQKKTI